jgi:hypothetical protein
MKVTIELDAKADILDAVHSDVAWAALREIQRLLRSNEKHDVGGSVTLQRIGNEVIEAFEQRGLE